MLSLVPGNARDIRDASTLTFADLEARRFRARVLGIIGWVLYALAAAVAILALVRAYGGLGMPAKRRSTLISGRAVLQQAGRELAAVNRARQADGWTDALVARAAAAMRVVAGYAIGMPAAQRPGVAANALDGQFALSQGLLRRRRALVSSAVTPDDLAAAAESGGTLQRLRDGLVAMTSARFGRQTLDEAAVEGAMGAASDLAGRLAWRHSWPMEQWARFTRRVAVWRSGV